MHSKNDCGRLTVKRSTLLMEWTIEKFFSKSETPEFELESPTFEMPSGTWHLKISNNILTISPPLQMIKIRLVSDKLLKFQQFNCTFAIKKEKNGTFRYGKTSTMFNPTKFLIRNVDGVFVLNNKHVYTANDTVVFRLEITFDKNNTPCSTRETNPFKGVHTVLGNFRDIYNRSICCDVTLKVGERKFNAHKSILSVSSPVFASMFEHDMKEKNTGVVKIEDCDPDSFHEFLEFLYTADTNKFSMETIFNLYTIADKYDVKQLIEECIQFMLDHLSVEVFCDVLQVAVKYNELNLIKSAKMFFMKNIKHILTTEQWQSFINENGTVANELFIQFVKRQNLS